MGSLRLLTSAGCCRLDTCVHGELSTCGMLVHSFLRTTPGPSLEPTPGPSPAPSAVLTPAPTTLSMVPELVEARLAAAVHGVDLIFEPGWGSSGSNVDRDVLRNTKDAKPRVNIRWFISLLTTMVRGCRAEITFKETSLSSEIYGSIPRALSLVPSATRRFVVSWDHLLGISVRRRGIIRQRYNNGRRSWCVLQLERRYHCANKVW